MCSVLATIDGKLDQGEIATTSRGCSSMICHFPHWNDQHGLEGSPATLQDALRRCESQVVNETSAEPVAEAQRIHKPWLLLKQYGLLRLYDLRDS
jgi:hypothetical protein